MHGEGLGTGLGALHATARRLTRCGEHHGRWRGHRGSGLHPMQLITEYVLWGCLYRDVSAGVGVRTHGSYAVPTTPRPRRLVAVAKPRMAVPVP